MPRRMGGAGICNTVLVLLAAAVMAPAADPDQAHLLYHVETVEGQVLASQGGDRLFNPASVVKVGTTLWAIERLGPDYRYETVVGISGDWDRERGCVDGALVVAGGGDPDFHLENAFLVARELNRLGVRSLSGGLILTGRFTMGWEHGVSHRQEDEAERAREMGRRLQQALDPQRWDDATRAAWQGLCERRGWGVIEPPSVVVAGEVEHRGAVRSQALVRHRSNPLPVLLRRFNVYSNNDIIRVADGLGGAAALEQYLRRRLGAGPEELQLATASGEERNRMTPRLVVHLLRELRSSAAGKGLALQELLPVPGCDPGPVPRMFSRLASGAQAGALACKTGTLVQQDRGVAVLAGSFVDGRGEQVLFSVAATEAGSRLAHWRRVEESWLLEEMARLGGVQQQPCAPALPFSDSDAIVEPIPLDQSSDIAG